MVTAGDNPERLRSEAAWANLCGGHLSWRPRPKVTRHRLDPGGDRHANRALWRIVMVRMVHDPDTKDYLERRMKEDAPNGRSSAS